MGKVLLWTDYCPALKNKNKGEKMKSTRLAIMIGILGLVGFVAGTRVVQAAPEPQPEPVQGIFDDADDRTDYVKATATECKGKFKALATSGIGASVMQAIPSAEVAGKAGILLGTLFNKVNEWGKPKSYWPGSQVRPIFFCIAANINDAYKSQYAEDLAWP